MQDFSFQGKLYLGNRLPGGRPGALRWVGDAPKCDLTLKTETETRKESYSGNRLTSAVLQKGKEAWTITERFPVWGGTLVTASDVVFYGSMEGWFKAVNARTGEVLWSFKTDSGIIGQPTTYRGPDGHQYVAILSGVGGWAGAVVSNDLDVRDGTAAKGFVNAVRELKDLTTKGGTLYVFRLP